VSQVRILGQIPPLMHLYFTTMCPLSLSSLLSVFVSLFVFFFFSYLGICLYCFVLLVPYFNTRTSFLTVCSTPLYHHLLLLFLTLHLANPHLFQLFSHALSTLLSHTLSSPIRHTLSTLFSHTLSSLHPSLLSHLSSPHTLHPTQATC
jgi:hypothetical protein